MASPKPQHAKKTPEKKIWGFTVREIKLLVITLLVMAVAVCALFLGPKLARESRNAKVLKEAGEYAVLCNTGTHEAKDYRVMAQARPQEGYALTGKEGTLADANLMRLIFTAEDADSAVPCYSVRGCKSGAKELAKNFRATYGGYLSDIITETEVMTEELGNMTVYTYIVRYRYEDPEEEGRPFHEKAVLYADTGFDSAHCVGVDIENHYADEASFASDEEILAVLKGAAQGLRTAE